jgi:hypothetical protein
VVLGLVFSSGIGTFFARRAVVMLKIDEPGSIWKGPVPLMLGAIGDLVYLLPLALLVTWSLDLTGSTIAKRLLGLQVRDAHGMRPSASRSWSRSALRTVGLWGCTLALIVGRWELAAAAIAAWLVVIAGMLLALGPASLAWHDRVTGTSVVHVSRPAIDK